MKHSHCYGNMFPTINAPPSGRPVQGSVFRVELHRAGGMAIATRKTSVDLAKWDDCVQCEEYLTCFNLSMAKLALETGVMQN